jgi:RNA polymerase sigma factor (sigma-70 family)
MVRPPDVRDESRPASDEGIGAGDFLADSIAKLNHFDPAVRLSGMEAMTGAAGQDLAGVVASAAAGDEYAFARIVAAYHEDMRRVCAFVTRDDALADEAVQAAWSTVWRKLGSVRQPERIRPWLVSIAVNQARDLLRKGRRRTEAELLASARVLVAGIDPATAIDSLDLLAAMDRLAPDDRALIAMRYVAGFDARELAAAARLSPSGTRARLARILERLRKELVDG